MSAIRLDSTERLLDDLLKPEALDNMSMGDLMDRLRRVCAISSREFKKLDKAFADQFEKTRKECVQKSTDIMKSKKILVLTLLGASLHGASGVVGAMPGALAEGGKLASSKLPARVSEIVSTALGIDYNNENWAGNLAEKLSKSVGGFATATDGVTSAVRNYLDAYKSEYQSEADSARSRKDELKSRAQEEGGRSEENLRKLSQAMDQEFQAAMRVLG